MANRQALAKALIRANNPQTGGDPAAGGFGSIPSAMQPAGAGVSPLVASYGDWTSGRGLGRGALPRDPATFLAGSFGPLSPMLPVPIDTPDRDTQRVDPRRWQYPVSWNMPHGVPGDEGLKLTSFANLRVIGQTYSVARACIQLRKAELLGLGWDVVPTKSAEKAMRGDRSARKEFDGRRAKMMRFWRRPDQQYFSFRDWFSVLLEDLLVIDALSVYLWPSRSRGKGVLGSNLGQLAALDGSTIRPLVDVHGATPLPPNPGFQQYLFGVPRTDLVTLQAGEDIAGLDMDEALLREYPADQLIYRPHNPVTWSPYGFAPIEQAIVPILAGIQRQQFQLDFFSEGTIPGLFVTNGDKESTPQQNRQLQDALNAMAGDPAWKHKIIVLPGGSQTMPQRPAELAGTFDEIIMTQTCMAFSVMPMELGITPRSSTSGHSGGAANQMGKMASDTQERKANRPTLEWFADIFNHVIQVVCGQDDMQWWWEGLEEDEDEQTKTDIQAKKVSIGLMSVDEARTENGQQPWGLPTTSDPVLITPTGVIPFGSIDPSTGQPEGLTPKLTAAPPPPGQLPPAPNGGGDGSGGTKPPAPKPTGPAGGAKPADAKPAATPAHAGAQQHAATTAQDKPQGTGGSKPASAPAQPAKKVDTFAALRELDLIRRRITKGRGIGGWVPEHVPVDVFADLAHAATVEAVEQARTAVKAIGHQQRRAQAIAPAQRRIVDGLHGLTAGLADGTVATAQFVDHAVEVVRAGIRDGLAVGTRAAVDAAAVKLTEFEEWQQAFDARFAQYAQTAQTAYDEGLGLATLSQPGEWLIRWDAKPGACDLCDDRNGETFAPGDLPGLPGMGGFRELATVCRGGPNCRCGITYLRADEAPAASAQQPPPVPTMGGGSAGLALRAVDTGFQRDLQANLSAARRAREAGHTSPTEGPYAELLDRIAAARSEQQRPYLEGLLQDLVTAHGAASTGAPETVVWDEPNHGETSSRHVGGHRHGGLVTATVIATGTAAAITAQEQSQQRAAPATQPAPAANGQPTVVAKHEGHADLTHEVYAYLARHYPASVLDWVKDAHWHQPQQVSLSDIEMARRPGGARNQDKVNAIAHAVEDGMKLDPIVLVRTPAGLPYQIADGYHRTLALVHAGRRTVTAWVGDVDTDTGPWGAEMNRAKLNKVGPHGYSHGWIRADDWDEQHGESWDAIGHDYGDILDEAPFSTDGASVNAHRADHPVVTITFPAEEKDRWQVFDAPSPDQARELADTIEWALTEVNPGDSAYSDALDEETGLVDWTVSGSGYVAGRDPSGDVRVAVPSGKDTHSEVDLGEDDAWKLVDGLRDMADLADEG